MSFLYPRTITITRSNVQTAVGVLPYNGELRSNEAPIASGVPASIQFKKDAAKPDANLPGDTAKRSMWRIFFNLPDGTVRDRDIITDDLGIRYQVSAAYWNSMGYAAYCERLET